MAKTGPTPGTGGRPTIDIPWKKIDALCDMHTPASEILAFLKTIDEPVSRDTLDRRCKDLHGITFAEYVAQRHEAAAKPKLRKLQWKAAQDGNVTMLIWLGKQMLGQKDKIEQDNLSSDGSMTPQQNITTFELPENGRD